MEADAAQWPGKKGEQTFLFHSFWASDIVRATHSKWRRLQSNRNPKLHRIMSVTSEQFPFVWETGRMTFMSSVKPNVNSCYLKFKYVCYVRRCFFPLFFTLLFEHEPWCLLCCRNVSNCFITLTLWSLSSFCNFVYLFFK